VSTQADVLLRLRGELDAAGLTGTRIAASDESLTDQALATWRGLNASARAVIDQVNVHGYQGTSGNRSGLYDEVVVGGGKALRMSEHGDGDASGATVATNAMLDFGALHPTSWVYWQALDGGGWGLLDSDVGNGVISGVNPKWYVLAQLTRHVRPGDVLLAGGDPSGNTIATWNATASTLTLVTWNPGASGVDVVYDLTAFGAAAGPAQGWVTAASAGGPKYAPTKAVPVTGGGQLAVTVPAGSLATYVVAGVTA
jgi:galactan endo-1,6-beta-galactosidase